MYSKPKKLIQEWTRSDCLEYIRENLDLTKASQSSTHFEKYLKELENIDFKNIKNLAKKLQNDLINNGMVPHSHVQICCNLLLNLNLYESIFPIPKSNKPSKPIVHLKSNPTQPLKNDPIENKSDDEKNNDNDSITSPSNPPISQPLPNKKIKKFPINDDHRNLYYELLSASGARGATVANARKPQPRFIECLLNCCDPNVVMAMYLGFKHKNPEDFKVEFAKYFEPIIEAFYQESESVYHPNQFNKLKYNYNDVYDILRGGFTTLAARLTSTKHSPLFQEYSSDIIRQDNIYWIQLIIFSSIIAFLQLCKEKNFINQFIMICIPEFNVQESKKRANITFKELIPYMKKIFEKEINLNQGLKYRILELFSDFDGKSKKDLYEREIESIPYLYDANELFLSLLDVLKIRDPQAIIADILEPFHPKIFNGKRRIMLSLRCYNKDQILFRMTSQVEAHIHIDIENIFDVQKIGLCQCFENSNHDQQLLIKKSILEKDFITMVKQLGHNTLDEFNVPLSEKAIGWRLNYVVRRSAATSNNST